MNEITEQQKHKKLHTQAYKLRHSAEILKKVQRFNFRFDIEKNFSLKVSMSYAHMLTFFTQKTTQIHTFA